MTTIKQLSEITYTTPPTPISFKATVIDVLSEGDGDKRPFKFTLKLEESGENIVVSSWKFDNLPTVKSLVMTDDVYDIEGTAGNFGNYGDQIRVGNISPTGLHSNKKVIRTRSMTDTFREISTLISTYIKTDSIKLVIKRLILDNTDYFKWPAATKVHHNYEGGLAIHSLGVANNALSIWKNYNGENLDVELLIAGSLLHDIGKLDEYNLDGSRTIYGNLMPHPVSGEWKISKEALLNGIDPDKDTKLLMLRHIVLTHHEKLEFGAPTQPYIPEAWVVAQADALDAKVESINAAMPNLQQYQGSEKLIALEGKVLKWK